MSAQVLCALAAVPDGGSTCAPDPRQPAGSHAPDVVLLRRDGRVSAWLNRCPHRGTPLDMVPGRVLDPSGAFIVCATHGALFESDTGLCVAGPCTGDRLAAVPVEVRGDEVWVVG